MWWVGPAPRKKARKARPAGAEAGPVSPEKRAHGGKATSSVGLACSLDRNYKRFVMFENGTMYIGIWLTPNTTVNSVVALTAIKISFGRS